MSGEHTPGPWEIDGTGCVLRTKTGVNDRGGMTGGVGIAQFFGENTPSEADARLIAAAPDLLAALRDVLHDIDHETMPVTVECIEAAIAKAEGGA